MNTVSPVARPLTIKSRQFRMERQAAWQELEELLDRAQSFGFESISAEQLQRLPLLYRCALSSLSVARSIALDRALVLYLENLSLRAFLAVYAPPKDVGRTAREFVSKTLPRAVRALRWQVLIMICAIALGTLSGYLLVDRHEGWFSALVPDALAGDRGPLSTREDLQHVLTAPLPDLASTLEMMGNSLFAHNTSVSLLVFGLGFLGGIPSILITFDQGLILGAFFAIHAHRGLAMELTGWIFIHGVTELGAIALFGAAGLKLGELLIFPGPYTRAENYAIHGGTIGAVAVGGAGMLLIAAILEGVFRQAIVSTDLRMIVAFCTLVGWIGYFAYVGRQGAE